METKEAKEAKKQLEQAQADLEKVTKEIHESNGKDEKVRKLIMDQVRLASTVKALETSISAMETMDKVPEEIAEIKKGFEKYRKQKAAKVKEAEKALNDNREAISEAKEKARSMIESGEIEELIEQNALLESLQRRDPILEKIVDDTKALKAFPDNYFVSEWENYAESKREELETLASRIETLKKGYLSAVDAIICECNALMQIRNLYQTTAKENGEDPVFSSILTSEKLADRLHISKPDGMKVRTICRRPSMTGAPL